MTVKWLDNRTTFNFFYFDYTQKNFNRFHDKTFYNKINKQYNLAPELSNFHKLKDRTELLSKLYGKQYSQSLLYWHLTLNRFIRLSIPINRLSYLLNDSFLYFESFLHFKTQWNDGKKGHYRDHTLHTTGEAYTGVEFLTNNTNIRECLKWDIRKTTHETGRFFREFSDISENNLDHIVYKTWLISSLFHDVGYVISFNKELNANMRKFHPYSTMLFNSNFPSFEKLQYTLGNSLLFRTIDHTLIKESYDKNKHGVFSAMLLLLTYYSAPAFDGVSHDDRIAIELAARSIFFHDFPGEPEDKITISRRRGQKKNHIELKKVIIGEHISTKIKKKMVDAQILKCEQILINHDIKCSKNNREAYTKNPFAFFLRFIDELQVFGRSQLSFVESKSMESEHSFQSNRIRNLVRFPAQIVDFSKEDKIQIYYILDNNLLKGQKRDKDFVEWVNINNTRSGITYFLKELFWLQKSIKDENLDTKYPFPEIEYFLIHVS